MCKNCKQCPHSYSLQQEYSYSNFVDDNTEDWYCTHRNATKSPQTKRLILDFVDKIYEPEITPPHWCPLKTIDNTDSKAKKRKTIQEQMQALRKADGPSTWDSIEVGKIYHCPPLGREKRHDFLIVSKTPYLLTCREINLNNPTSYYTRTFYKSDFDTVKFFVPHQIIDLEAQIEQKNDII